MSLRTQHPSHTSSAPPSHLPSRISCAHCGCSPLHPVPLLPPWPPGATHAALEKTLNYSLGVWFVLPFKACPGVKLQRFLFLYCHVPLAPPHSTFRPHKELGEPGLETKGFCQPSPHPRRKAKGKRGGEGAASKQPLRDSSSQMLSANYLVGIASWGGGVPVPWSPPALIGLLKFNGAFTWRSW